MKIYKLDRSVLVEYQSSFYQFEVENWNTFINDDNIYQKTQSMIADSTPIENAESLLSDSTEPPMQDQELWASGVTYLRSKQGRQEESNKSGGSDFYARVYEAERPELFFKATRQRVVGNGGEVRIRKDSTWDVPEPELVLMISSSGKIIGYSIGNDMSSRSIEGENPLYLPQAKTYDGCAALGPCIYISESPIPTDTQIHLNIERQGKSMFQGSIGIDQITRKLEDLAEFLFRECTFPYGALLMTGTGIVPGNDFTLQTGDSISIGIDHIGTLKNTVG